VEAEELSGVGVPGKRFSASAYMIMIESEDYGEWAVATKFRRSS
jgi:hypothetical protein